MKKQMIVLLFLLLFLASCVVQKPCKKYVEEIQCKTYLEKTYPCPTYVEYIEPITLCENITEDGLCYYKFIFDVIGNCKPYESLFRFGNVSERVILILENSTTNFYTIKESCLENWTVFVCVE